jgi:hypothetical protein
MSEQKKENRQNEEINVPMNNVSVVQVLDGQENRVRYVARFLLVEERFPHDAVEQLSAAQ